MAEQEKAVHDLSALRIQREPESGRQGNSRRRGQSFLIALGVFVILALLTYIFGGRLLLAPKVQVATVVTIVPSQADAVLTASGYVVAQRQAAVASKGTGRLEYLGVEEGDRVKAGQIIARIEHEDVDAALAQARANAALARASLEQAQAEQREASLLYERQRGLLAQQLISQWDFDQAEARYKRATAAVASAEAGIRAAEAAVRGAEVAVENTNIRAPFDGTVLTKNAEVGEVVAPFGSALSARAAVVTLADMSSLEVEADVSESNIERVRVGQPCEIVLDAFPERRYRGVVHKIVPTADRAKATVLTKIRFVGRDERVLPEMSAKVTFLAKALSDSAVAAAPKLAVSSSAIVTRGGQKVAFVVREKVVVQTPLEAGDTIGALVEVRRGLSVGDTVVLNPRGRLKTGSRVRIAEE